MVNVYDENGKVVGRVNYNSIWTTGTVTTTTCGSTGRHWGSQSWKDGRFVLIHGTQWQGEQDTAEVVTAEEALQAILSSGNEELLEEARFSELKKLNDESMAEEE
jgi:hypothetical protein